MLDPKISFEKWIDPINPKSVIKDRSEYTPEETEILDSLKIKYNSEKDVDAASSETKMKNMRFIMGPMGVIPMDEQNYPDTNYNLWVYHTNFDVGENISKTISTNPGVEIFKVWTRYRGWIGIAKMFDHNKVFSEIKQGVKKYFNVKPENKLYGKEAAVYSLNEVLSSNFKHYSIYQAPNKTMFPIYGENENQLKETEQKYVETFKNIKQNI
jgi:hypothetical protein